MIPQSLKNPITAVLAAALVVAGAVYLILTKTKSSYGTSVNTFIDDHGLLNASLVTLSTASSSQERLLAARWLGSQSKLVNSYLVQTLSRCLTSDADPSVRSEIANTLGELASKHNSQLATPGPSEPQMISVLFSSYSQESNASVRRAIVTAAGEFNHPDAARLLNKALTDEDPAVREAAQKAKLKRQRRQLMATSG